MGHTNLPGSDLVCENVATNTIFLRFQCVLLGFWTLRNSVVGRWKIGTIVHMCLLSTKQPWLIKPWRYGIFFTCSNRHVTRFEPFHISARLCIILYLTHDKLNELSKSFFGIVLCFQCTCSMLLQAFKSIKWDINSWRTVEKFARISCENTVSLHQTPVNLSSVILLLASMTNEKLRIGSRFATAYS